MTTRRRALLAACLGLVLVSLLGSGASAQPAAVPLTPDTKTYDVVGRVEVLEDPSGELSLDELRGGEGAWSVARRADPNFGFSASAYWLRLRLFNPGGDRISSVLAFSYPHLDHIDAYVERSDGRFRHQVLGDRHPFAIRDLPFGRHALLVTTWPQQTQSIYLRIRSSSSMQLGVELASYEGFVGIATRDQMIAGLYYGIMLAMALYNLFLYIAVRDRSYLLYVLFVVVFTASQLTLDGTASRFLFPVWPGFANLFTPVAIVGCQVPGVLFTQRFLDTRRQVPRVHRALDLYQAPLAIGLALALLAPYPIAIRYAAAFAILTSLLCSVVGVGVLWKTRYRPARFYVLAFTSLLAGTILYALTSFGVLPANILTLNVQRIGSALQVTLLSFALGDSIKMMEHERERARSEALALDRDLALTAAVQHLFLPRQDELVTADVSLIGFYRPATRCGGDWWWHERLPDGSLLVMVGDVTGHGPSAAMMTAVVASTYRSLGCPPDEDGVERMLRSLGDAFCKIAGETHSMSLLAMVVSPKTGRMRMWNAGGPPAFIAHADGDVHTVLLPSRPIGSQGSGALELVATTCELGPRDRIMLFSDGLPELVKPTGRQLGYRGVQRMLVATQGCPLEAARDQLIAALDRQRAGVVQHDDLTFVLIDVRRDDQYRSS